MTRREGENNRSEESRRDREGRGRGRGRNKRGERREERSRRRCHTHTHTHTYIHTHTHTYTHTHTHTHTHKDGHKSKYIFFVSSGMLTLCLSLSFSEVPSDTVQGSFSEFRPFSPQMTCQIALRQEVVLHTVELSRKNCEECIGQECSEEVVRWSTLGCRHH